jgi:hypothetical protein
MESNTLLYILIAVAVIILIFYLMKCKIVCPVVPPPHPPFPDICTEMYLLCMSISGANKQACLAAEQKCRQKHHESYADEPLLFPDEILL